MRESTVFRNLPGEGRIVVAPGTTAVLFGYLVESAGFDLVYATGAGIANMNFCFPDDNLGSMNENLAVIKRINDAIHITVVADIDNGYGTSAPVYRAAKEFTAAGVSGLQMEDKKFPKRCGHFENKGHVSKGEMIGKIKAARDASVYSDMVLIARTDAVGVTRKSTIQRTNYAMNTDASLRAEGETIQSAVGLPQCFAPCNDGNEPKVAR